MLAGWLHFSLRSRGLCYLWRRRLLGAPFANMRLFLLGLFLGLFFLFRFGFLFVAEFFFELAALRQIQPEIDLLLFAFLTTDIVEVLFFKRLFGFLFFVEGLFLDLFNAPLGACALDGDLRRWCRRRMRLQESTHLLRRVQVPVYELQEDLVNDVLVSREVGRNPHLLQQGMRNTLARLWPGLQEELVLRLDSTVFGGEPEPKHRFRVIGGE